MVEAKANYECTHTLYFMSLISRGVFAPDSLSDLDNPFTARQIEENKTPEEREKERKANAKERRKKLRDSLKGFVKGKKKKNK